MVADGTFIPITHVGSITLYTTSGKLPLNDVLVCPTIQKPLLYVSKLCDEYPCGVYFDADNVCVLDKQTQKVLTKGNMHDSLYKLEDPGVMAFYSSRQQVVSDDVWHQQLGHPNPQILQLLKNNKEISNNKSNTNSICEPC